MIIKNSRNLTVNTDHIYGIEMGLWCCDRHGYGWWCYHKYKTLPSMMHALKHLKRVYESDGYKLRPIHVYPEDFFYIRTKLKSTPIYPKAVKCGNKSFFTRLIDKFL